MRSLLSFTNFKLFFKIDRPPYSIHVQEQSSETIMTSKEVANVLMFKQFLPNTTLQWRVRMLSNSTFVVAKPAGIISTGVCLSNI